MAPRGTRTERKSITRSDTGAKPQTERKQQGRISHQALTSGQKIVSCWWE
jgi:hypothetical protein